MSQQPQIAITGAAGFIGSALVGKLNEMGFTNLALIDNFQKPGKNRYLADKMFFRHVLTDELFHYLQSPDKPDFIFHLGGKTSHKDDFTTQNVEYPWRLFEWAKEHDVPFLYASSASTYGAGELGYDDDDALIHRLRPLNDYGRSKHEFDLRVLDAKAQNLWAGLKIFNVFGPNEYHKGASASVAFKSFFEIKESGTVTLFGSSKPQFAPGEQLRDFIYVKDVLNIFYWFLEQWLQKGSFPSGIFNAGTGTGRSFNDVARLTFEAMGLPESIQYKDIPGHIIASYPDQMIAKMNKLHAAGYKNEMHTLEDAINDLVRKYLLKQRYL